MTQSELEKVIATVKRQLTNVLLDISVNSGSLRSDKENFETLERTRENIEAIIGRLK